MNQNNNFYGNNEKENNLLNSTNNAINTIGTKKNNNKIGKSGLAKEEIIYNIILKIITISTIILIATIIIVTIKKVFFDFGIDVFSKMLESNPGSGRGDWGIIALPFVIGFKAYMIVPLAIVGIIIQIFLIVLAFKIRNTKNRKIKWWELFYLLFLSLITFVVGIIAELISFNSIILKLVCSVIEYGRIVDIILLLIILLKSRRKTIN